MVCALEAVEGFHVIIAKGGPGEICSVIANEYSMDA